MSAFERLIAVVVVGVCLVGCRGEGRDEPGQLADPVPPPPPADLVEGADSPSVPAPDLSADSGRGTPADVDAPPARPAEDPTSAAPAVMEITAKALLDEYAKDAAAAEEKFQGKNVRVTGKVGSVLGEKVYISEGPESQTISLQFPSVEDAERHFAGQEIVVEGRVGIRSIFGPCLDDFRIISASPEKPPEDKPIELTAAELTKAFEDDPEAAEKRFSLLDQVTVEGTVKEVSVDDEGQVSVLLAGHTEFGGVMFNTFKDNETVKSKVKEGQTIKVRGAWYGEVAGMYIVGYGELVE
jgi:hypothetical protein